MVYVDIEAELEYLWQWSFSSNLCLLGQQLEEGELKI